MATRALLSSGLTIPAAGAINSVASARGVAAAGARSVVPLVYGVDRQPALILNVLPAADSTAHYLVQCLWAWGLHLITELRLNDQALPTGHTLTHYLGTQTTPDAALVAAFAAQGITYADTLAGFAYSVVRLPKASFDGRLDLSAELWGRKVYDRRLDSTAGGTGPQRLADPTTWAHSHCPALHLADWLASPVYGAGEAVDWSSVPAAADANDGLVGSPAEPRRRSGVTLARDTANVQAVAEALRAYAGVWLVPTAAGMRLLPDVDAAPVATYSHAAGQIARIEPLALRDLGNVPTAVEVRYTDTSQIPWREASAVASVPGAGTTKPWRLSPVSLPGIQRHSQAYREAVERLNKLHLGDLSCALEVFDAGIRHEQGDIIAITHPLGLAAKTMRVTDVLAAGPGRWRLQVAEHDPAAYSDAVVTTPSVPDTTRVLPGAAPDNVAGFTGTAGKGRVTWRWTPDLSPDYGTTELRTTDAGWGLASPAPVFRGAASTWSQDVTAAGTYTLYARHFNLQGLASAAAVQTSVVVTAADLVQDGVGMLTLVPQGAVAVAGGDVSKTSAGDGWNAGAYSLELYTGGAFCSFQPGQLGAFTMAGLTRTPAADAGYTSIDYIWYCNSANEVQVYLGPTPVGSFGSYTTSTVLAIVYDGAQVTWLKDGVVQHSVAAASDLKLAFDCSLYTGNSALQNIRFGPSGTRGADGAAGPEGPQGVAGAAGTSVAEINAYIRSSSAPPSPSGGSFNFASQALTPPAGWSVGVPAGTDTVWVARGLAASTTPGATVTPTWGAAAAAFSDGQAVDVIFRRASSEPATPSPSAGVPAGWYSSVGSVPAGSDPMWSSFGERAAPAANWLWQAPVRVQGVDGAAGPTGAQGVPGAAGAAGTSVAEINAYIRSSSTPPTPSGGSFDFSTQVLTPPAGWSVGVPAGSDPVYVSRGLAVTTTPGAAVSPSWGAAARAFQDGQAVDVVFIRAATQPGTPAASSGVPSGWYATVASVPAGSDPMWSSFGERASAAANWTWQAPVRVQGVDGSPGAPGADAAPTVRLQISQAAIVLAADFDGNVASFSGASATVAMYVNEVLDTSNWAITRTDGAGITTSLAGATVSVTASTTDTGYVDITATRSGFAAQTLRVPITKARSQVRPERGGNYVAATGQFTPTDAAVSINFKSNGVVDMVEQGVTSSSNWYSPTTSGVGAGYEILFTPLSADGYSGGESGAASGSWLGLGTDRGKTLTTTENGAGFRIRNFSYAIRRLSDGVQVATGTLYLEASVET